MMYRRFQLQMDTCFRRIDMKHTAEVRNRNTAELARLRTMLNGSVAENTKLKTELAKVRSEEKLKEE